MWKSILPTWTLVGRPHHITSPTVSVKRWLKRYTKDKRGKRRRVLFYLKSGFFSISCFWGLAISYLRVHRFHGQDNEDKKGWTHGRLESHQDMELGLSFEI